MTCVYNKNILSSGEMLLKSAFNKFATQTEEKYITVESFISIVTLLKPAFFENKIGDNEKILIKAIFLYFDKDSDGVLNFKEFREWWIDKNRNSYFSSEKSKRICDAWYLFETHSNGKNFIIWDGFLKLAETINLRQSTEDANYNNFGYMDANNDGCISFREFCLWLKWF